MAERLSGAVIGAAMEVHRELGPGLLESAYAQCLAHELACRGIAFEAEVAIPIRFKGLNLPCAGRMDLVVEDRLVVELKSVQDIEQVHVAQLLGYLRSSGKSLGLLINFNVPLLRQGIRRIVNRHPTADP